MHRHHNNRKSQKIIEAAQKKHKTMLPLGTQASYRHHNTSKSQEITVTAKKT